MLRLFLILILAINLNAGVVGKAAKKVFVGAAVAKGTSALVKSKTAKNLAKKTTTKAIDKAKNSKTVKNLIQNTTNKTKNALQNTKKKIADYKSTQNGNRPSWKQSEKDEAISRGNNVKEQVSYKNGQEVPCNTPGCVKPDIVHNGTAIEVKNYKIENASNMINNLANQINKRASELPSNMKQEVVIDFRGQNVGIAQKNEIINKIIGKTNGILKPENIIFR